MIKRLILMSIFSLSAYAAPDCNMTLTLTNATVLAHGYDQVVQQNFTVSRSSNNDNRCTGYRMYFGKGIANSYQRETRKSDGSIYQYNLHSNINKNGILKDFNDALNTNEYISGLTPQRNTNYSGSFFISIPGNHTQNNPPAGIYTDNVQVSLYRQNSGGGLNLEVTTTFTFSLTVESEIAISLVDIGGAFDKNSTYKILDFGNLQQNQELGADMIVDANSPYQIRFSSQNNGVLNNGVDTIGYQTSVNENPVNLSTSATAPVTVITKSSPSSTNKDRYTIKVKITSPTENKISGQYQDSITITTIAN